MLDRRYQTLITLAQYQSFTKTAQKLYITQPAVSQQISSLEEELHFDLVIREHSKIQLTPAGKKLAQFAIQIESEGNKVITNLRDKVEHLKMGCTLSLSSTILPKFVQQLSTRTNIVTTKINNTQHILQNIRDGKVDFGLIEGNFNKSEFDAFLLGKESFIGVAHKKYQCDSIESLFDKPLLLREKGSGSREIFENWLATQNYNINDFKNTIEIASPSAIIEYLKQSDGISFMYQSLVIDELKTEQLKKLDLTGFHVEHPINLVFLKNSYFKNIYQEIAESV